MGAARLLPVSCADSVNEPPETLIMLGWGWAAHVTLGR